MASPIADLTYRGYDGPLESPRHRWWVISRVSVRQAIKKKGFWIAMVFSGWYYIALIAIIFFLEQFAGNAPPGPANPTSFIKGIVWKDQFLHGFSFAQLMLLIVALMLGSGSIANDNRANALLVYLSKPCTKLDYLIGKWVGVFLPLLAVVGIPTIVFYLYGALSYRTYGFLSSDPWLLPKMLVILPFSAAFYASIIVGISSLFNQGRLAGAACAGTYFLSNFMTILMTVALQLPPEGESAPKIVGTFSYLSMDGLVIGLAKAILGTDGGNPFNAPGRGPHVNAPSLFLMLILIVGISSAALGIAWRRIRAVEVIG